ncbi:hypothetical protein KUCAC02_013429 [Chaenocephalus aceratus]|nr:hypothetical protein KUCAC02_013429 [Chaenocephalus aceratus]
MLSKTTSVSSAHLPPAPHQPAVLSPPDYPLMQYVPTPSTAGTQSLKGRRDMIMPLSHPQTSLPPVSLPRPPTPRPLPSPSPSTATRAIAGPSTRPIVPAIAGRPILLATSTIARPVPSLFPGPILPASQPTPTIAGPSSMPLLPAIQATPSADVSVPTTLECIPSSWARSTLYKRKGMDEPSGVGVPGSKAAVVHVLWPTHPGAQKVQAQSLLPCEEDVSIKGSGEHSLQQLQTMYSCC